VTELEQRVAHLEAALAREQRVSHALREVGKALGTTLELDDLLELILSNLRELVQADRATLYLLDESTRSELVSRVVVGQQIRSIRIRVGRGIAGYVAQTGKSLRVRDVYDDPRFEREWDALTGYRSTSMLAAPLKNHLGRTIGVIQVLNKKSGPEFTEQDEAMVTSLSTQAAVAIDNSRLFLSLIQKNKQLVDTKEQLERRLRDLVLLFDLERATARADSVDALVTASLRLAARACEARGAAILVAAEETGELVQYVLDVTRPDHLDRFGIREGEGLLAAAMGESDALLVRSATEDSRWSERVEGRFPFLVENVMAVSLDGEQTPLGAIGLFGKQGARSFDAQDVALLRLMSANVSTALRLFRASEARERSERLTAIGRLLSQVIHDFKTPMTVISGYVQLMQDQDERAQRTESVEQILRQFDALTSMQREVLEFARGERSLFVRRVFLKKFFAEVRANLQHELDSKPIELVMDVDAKVVARFDEARVARAVHNLARNAIEAMQDHGGRLTLSGRMAGEELVIGVEDTGSGIPKEIEGRLFQSFVTAGKKGGTGLGLAIVKKIVDEHRGNVRVETSPRGTRFELRLPQVRSEDASALRERPSPPPNAQRSLHVTRRTEPPRAADGARREGGRRKSEAPAALPAQALPAQALPAEPLPAAPAPTGEPARRKSEAPRADGARNSARPGRKTTPPRGTTLKTP
jgi:signal transduction histidine kinase